ncbi:MAG TPA: hypothetical protein ENH23_03890, partial [candidate division Zixibacteria bacterium]|nr:hypothetical protein [candidate division Zixibacteria bacterium]
MNKREFIKTLAVSLIPTTVLVGGSWFSFTKLLAKKKSLPFRPPGAIAESEFLAKCIRCRRCGQVCPNETIKYFDTLDPVMSGTPYF